MLSWCTSLAYVPSLKRKVFILHTTVDHQKNSIVFKCYALVSCNSRTAAVPLLMYVHEQYINTQNNNTVTILNYTYSQVLPYSDLLK